MSSATATIKDDLTHLNIEQAERAVACCFKAGVPVAVWGDPGTGKSAMMNQLAERMGCRMYDVRSSILEPSDFGIPYPENGQVRWLRTEMLPYAENDAEKEAERPAILLFDEFDRTSQEVLNAELQIIHDRRLNGHELAPGTMIAACGNGASDIGTTKLSRAAMNRMCHLYINDDTKSAHEGWKNWAIGRGNVSPEMVSFCDFIPQEKSKTKFESYAYRTRRSIVNADKVYRTAVDIGNTDDILVALVGGCIGKDQAMKFVAHAKTIKAAPDIQEIIANPTGSKVPKDPGTLFALGELMISYAASEEKSGCKDTAGHNVAAESFIRYANRWPAEPRTAFDKALIRAMPGLRQTKAYKELLASAPLGTRPNGDPIVGINDEGQVVYSRQAVVKNYWHDDADNSSTETLQADLEARLKKAKYKL